MKIEAVSHRASGNWCYPLNEDELIVNLRTGHDVEQVFIYQGDPFDGGIAGGNWKWTGTREEVCFKKQLKNHFWWTTTLKPAYKRCKYYFELQTSQGRYYYCEDGCYTEEQLKQKEGQLSCFTFPWMNTADINRTPKWVNDIVWYQIFPERFCNGDSLRSPENVRPWGYHRVTNEEFYGGDLEGVIQKLDYLKELGITGIYLTPIFEGESVHKYDTTDYMKIDPHFGDEDVFRRLVEEVHARGMKIMLDGVFNHCGEKFKPWQDVLENGPKSKYYEWFMINEWPIDPKNPSTRDGKFYSFGFTSYMPKLNTNNKEVRDFLLKVVEYWVSSFHIDGLRLDVANELSHLFCKELRTRVKSLDPEFYILGEIWNDSIEWLRGDEFDAVMNYPLGGSISDFWRYKDRTKADFECDINRNYAMYMQQTNDVLFNLLDSHDTNRLMDQVKDKDVFYQQLAVLFTMPGSPCIFYGTEIAMEGGHDPDCRRCMPWEDIEKGVYEDDIRQLSRLIQLRKEQKVFRSRHLYFLNTVDDKRVLEYIKVDDDGNQIQVLLNASDHVIDAGKGGSTLYKRLSNDTVIEPKGILIRNFAVNE